MSSPSFYTLNNFVSTPHSLFGPDEYQDVNSFFEHLKDYHSTPLHRLNTLSLELGLKEIFVKDESARFGLNAFKIAGVSYAINRLQAEGRLAQGGTVVCATEGNHGRAVAHAACKQGLKAIVYMSSTAAPVRVRALIDEGAEVRQVEGNYDDAVRQASRDADLNGWLIVSDTSWPGYEQIPLWIMNGYTRIMEETAAQWEPGPGPDVVFVQAGVGGLLGAVASWIAERFGEKRPHIVGCEPSAAPSLSESIRVGHPVTLTGYFDSIMAGLRVGELSPVAWPALISNVDAAIAVDDALCAPAMRRLASDLNVKAGASGACALAALTWTMLDPAAAGLRDALRLGPDSMALVIVSEGATDPELYERLVSG